MENEVDDHINKVFRVKETFLKRNNFSIFNDNKVVEKAAVKQK